jgi:hypothetical protein
VKPSRYRLLVPLWKKVRCLPKYSFKAAHENHFVVPIPSFERTCFDQLRQTFVGNFGRKKNPPSTPAHVKKNLPISRARSLFLFFGCRFNQSLCASTARTILPIV